MIFISSRLLQELKRIPDCAAGVINGVTRNSPDGFTSAREAAFCKTHGRYAPGVGWCSPSSWRYGSNLLLAHPATQAAGM